MWFKIENHQVKINVLAKPNAKKTAFLEVSSQGMHISLHANPRDGEANKELLAYLAKLFRLPKSQILLRRGECSRQKQIVLPLTDLVQQFLNDPKKFISNGR